MDGMLSQDEINALLNGMDLSDEGGDDIELSSDVETEEIDESLLYDVEKDAIRLLTEKYEHVIVVLNVGSVIDTKFLRGQEGIDAILLMSQAGNIGGYALADVLTGKAEPCGRLTTT